MDAAFWHGRWAAGDIGFHEGEPNALLRAHWHRLALASGQRVFLPLCGKTRDIHWLLEQGYRVAGAELDQGAVEALFDELGMTPAVQQRGALRHYQAPGLDIFQGDIFALDKQTLGAVDAIYDRAALVALPPPLQRRYVAHLSDIAGGAVILLNTFDYDQRQLDGPPFSIPASAVNHHFDSRYRVSALHSREVEGGLKGQVAARETAWLLQPLSSD